MCDNQIKRVPKFSTSETELLTILVKKYSDVLENKKTDATNNILKVETWRKLAEDFNSTSGIYGRSSKTLRAKYENMKKTIKRKYGEHRRSLYRTGSGPPQDLNLTQEEEAIMELAGPSVEGLPARFDSDTITEQENIKTIPPKTPLTAEVLVHNTHIPHIVCTPNTKMEDKSTLEDETTVRSDFQVDSTPSRFILKRKKSTPLRLRNPESFNDTMESYSSLSKKKQDLVDAQIRLIEEKRAQDKREHELRCAQFENRAIQEAKEHDLKREVMQLDIMLKKKKFVPIIQK